MQQHLSMHQYLFAQHWADPEHNPAGGVTTGRGLTISWQNGPLVIDGKTIEPNGARVADAIWAALDRLQYHHVQFDQYADIEIGEASYHLKLALELLAKRIQRLKTVGKPVLEL